MDGPAAPKKHAVGLAGRALGLLGQGIVLGRGQDLDRQARTHQELAGGVYDFGADALARQRNDGLHGHDGSHPILMEASLYLRMGRQ